MRNLILSGLFTMAVVGGCVGSRERARLVVQAVGRQSRKESMPYSAIRHPIPSPAVSAASRSASDTSWSSTPKNLRRPMWGTG